MLAYGLPGAHQNPDAVPSKLPLVAAVISAVPTQINLKSLGLEARISVSDASMP
jgi:hypothetical protein